MSFRQNFGVAKLWTKKHSPEILLAVGIVSGVACVITACKATIKAQEVVEQHKITAEGVANGTMVVEVKDEPLEDKKEAQKIVAIKTAFALAKTYAVPALLGSVSLGCFVGSNSILNGRNVALTAANALLAEDFKSYRSRVVSKIGPEAEAALKKGLQTIEVEEEYTDSKGNVKTRKVKKEVIDPESTDMYTFVFDNRNFAWVNDDPNGIDRAFLENTQNYFNHILRIKGYVFLDEILSYLKYDSSASRYDDETQAKLAQKFKAGKIVGWRFDPKNEWKINFGLDDPINSENMVYARDSFILNFNVDGNIWETI